MSIEHVIGKVKESKVINEPFPHLVIDNFLDDKLYSSIIETLKTINFFEDENPKINRSTFMVHHKGKQFLKQESLKKFYEVLSNERLQDIVIDKLKPSRSQERFKNIWVQADCYRNEFKFPIHCDSGDKYVTFVLYTPTHDNLDKNLGTRVYNKKKELVDIVNYLPNRVIIFPPSTYSWHNMEGKTEIIRNSLQAWYLCSDKRKLAPKIRRGFNSS